MAEKEVKLMKGNEAIAHALIRCGADAFFGYPITPQTEIIETLSALKPWETTGMVESRLRARWPLSIWSMVALALVSVASRPPPHRVCP